MTVTYQFLSMKLLGNYEAISSVSRQTKEENKGQKRKRVMKEEKMMHEKKKTKEQPLTGEDIKTLLQHTVSPTETKALSVGVGSFTAHSAAVHRLMNKAQWLPYEYGFTSEPVIECTCQTSEDERRKR